MAWNELRVSAVWACSTCGANLLRSIRGRTQRAPKRTWSSSRQSPRTEHTQVIRKMSQAFSLE